MQIPIIPHRGQKKPWTSIPRINWGHPLTRNLSTYVYDMGGGMVIDLVTGSIGVKVGSSGPPTTGVGQVGSGYKWVAQSVPSTNGTGMAFANSAALQDNLTNALPFSFSGGFIRTGTVGDASDPGVVFCYADGTGSENTPLVVAVSNGNLAVGEYANSNILTGTSTVVANIFYTITCVANSAGEFLYFNGKQEASNALTNTFSHTGYKPQINRQNFSAATGANFGCQFAGFVYYGAAWKSRALTLAEVRQLNVDPWCFLIYPEDEMFATLVGVTAGPTTSEDQWHQPLSSVGRRYAIIAAG